MAFKPNLYLSWILWITFLEHYSLFCIIINEQTDKIWIFYITYCTIYTTQSNMSNLSPSISWMDEPRLHDMSSNRESSHHTSSGFNLRWLWRRRGLKQLTHVTFKPVFFAVWALGLKGNWCPLPSFSVKERRCASKDFEHHTKHVWGHPKTREKDGVNEFVICRYVYFEG